MSMEVKVPTKQIQDLVKKFAQAEAIYDEYARPGMEEAVSFILSKVVQKTPSDTSLLRGSIQTELRGRSLDLQGYVFTPSIYAPAIEYGLPIRKVFPPLEAIQRWVERKGISLEGATSRQVSYLIARGIYRRGTKGHMMFKTSMDESERFILDLFDKVNVRFLKRFQR